MGNPKEWKWMVLKMNGRAKVDSTEEDGIISNWTVIRTFFITGPSTFGRSALTLMNCSIWPKIVHNLDHESWSMTHKLWQTWIDNIWMTVKRSHRPSSTFCKTNSNSIGISFNFLVLGIFWNGYRTTSFPSFWIIYHVIINFRQWCEFDIFTNFFSIFFIKIFKNFFKYFRFFEIVLVRAPWTVIKVSPSHITASPVPCLITFVRKNTKTSLPRFLPF